jgi:hypothetical protein
MTASPLLCNAEGHGTRPPDCSGLLGPIPLLSHATPLATAAVGRSALFPGDGPRGLHKTRTPQPSSYHRGDSWRFVLPLRGLVDVRLLPVLTTWANCIFRVELLAIPPEPFRILHRNTDSLRKLKRSPGKMMVPRSDSLAAAVLVMYLSALVGGGMHHHHHGENSDCHARDRSGFRHDDSQIQSGSDATSNDEDADSCTLCFSFHQARVVSTMAALEVAYRVVAEAVILSFEPPFTFVSSIQQARAPPVSSQF